MDPLDGRLQELLDKQAITERIHDYARAMDRMDAPLGKECFCSEARVDYGAQIFQGTAHDFVDMCMKAHAGFQVHSHQISNVRIWLDGPQRARSEAYADVTLRRRDEAGTTYDIRNLGRYVDEWDKRDGEWRIAKRVFLLDFDQVGPSRSSLQTTGKRDRSDPSYFGR